MHRHVITKLPSLCSDVCTCFCLFLTKWYCARKVVQHRLSELYCSVNSVTHNLYVFYAPFILFYFWTQQNKLYLKLTGVNSSDNHKKAGHYILKNFNKQANHWYVVETGFQVLGRLVSTFEAQLVKALDMITGECISKSKVWALAWGC